MTRVASIETMKDLLLYGPEESVVNEELDDQWNQTMAELARNHDLFASMLNITAIADHAIYRAPDNLVRIFSVAFKKKTLGYSDKSNLDLVNPDWQNEDVGTPEIWAHNAIPGEVDVGEPIITPRDFLIFPAPEGAIDLTNAISLIYGLIPNDVPLWLEPLMMYSCVADFAQDNPNLTEPAKAEFFTKLSDLWIEIIKKRLQV